MPKEWIDIADTAIKIGLGSLITGVFTYLAISLSKKSEREKLLFEHRIKLIEIVAESVEAFFTSWDNYTSILSGVSLSLKKSNRESEGPSDKQWKSIQKQDDEFMEVWSISLNGALAKLRLMKANNAVNKLGDCAKLAREVRNEVAFDKDMPTHDKIQKYRNQKNIAKQAFYNALSDLYTSL